MPLLKASSTYTSYWQFLTIRSLFNFTIVFLICLIFFSARTVVPQNILFVLLRSLCVGICMICFFSGAVTLDFSLMIAGLYTYPIFITIMAAIILREKLNFARISGMTFGVLGSLLILEPWYSDISYMFRFLPICAGFLCLQYYNY